MPTDPSGTSMHVRFRPEACASGGDRDADACNRFANKSMASLGVPGATAFPPAAIGPCLSSSHESSAALPDVCADTFLGRAALRSDVLRAAADLTPCGRASGVGMLLIQQSVVEDALYAALRVSATAVPSSSSSGGEEHTATVDLLVVFSDEDVGSEFKVTPCLISCPSPPRHRFKVTPCLLSCPSPRDIASR